MFVRDSRNRAKQAPTKAGQKKLSFHQFAASPQVIAHRVYPTLAADSGGADDKAMQAMLQYHLMPLAEREGERLSGDDGTVLVGGTLIVFYVVGQLQLLWYTDDIHAVDSNSGGRAITDTPLLLLLFSSGSEAGSMKDIIEA